MIFQFVFSIFETLCSAIKIKIETSTKYDPPLCNDVLL